MGTNVSGNPPAGATLTSTCLAEVKMEPINWLWRKHLALGKLATIVGNPGDGKTMVTLDIAARVSRGSKWPDGTPGSAKPASVLILSIEDGIADTIAPRASYMGADLAKLHVVTAYREADKLLPDEKGKGEIVKPGRTRALNLSTDVAALRALAKKLGDVALIIVDPLSAYLGGVNTDRAGEVRAALAELQMLAEEMKLAVVFVMHMNKSELQSALHRASGSVAFSAVVRTAFVVTLDPKDLVTKLFLPIKTNLGKMNTTGRKFSLEGFDDGDTQKVKVVWGDATDIIADEAIAALTKRRADSTVGDKLKYAMDMVSAILAGGPKLVTEFEAEAKALGGFSTATLIRARNKLGVMATKAKGKFDGQWMVSLPPRAVSQNGAGKLPDRPPATAPTNARVRKYAK